MLKENIEIFDAGISANSSEMNIQEAYENVLGPILKDCPDINRSAAYVMFHRGWLAACKASIDHPTRGVYSTIEEMNNHVYPENLPNIFFLRSQAKDSKKVLEMMIHLHNLVNGTEFMFVDFFKKLKVYGREDFDEDTRFGKSESDIGKTMLRVAYNNPIPHWMRDLIECMC